ncbi:hypothetical protein O181_022355 [Austropuccinia psidii MF-1]|uniref:GH18 domain-containing protein n=1 Tax=Austropuccinia psidii MF-1 TaxID=1389203 RepID=A0A9Q3CH85_9BASI|nr:hypothetical protein [Austropuccinia psidii MF-1]
MWPTLAKFLAICLSLSSIATLNAKQDADHTKAGFRKTGKVMGYYPSYHHLAGSPHNINFSLYTDVLFFVVVPQLDFSFKFEKLEYSVGRRLAKEFISEAKKHRVNTIMSFGGWTGSLHFSKLASDPNRKRFARALVDFAKGFGFEGLDLDWEYPNRAGIGCNSFSPDDTKNFGLLIKEIRALWPKAQLTAALGLTGLIGASGQPATSSEMTDVVGNLDFVNLMAYDVYGAWAPTTGPIGPLKSTCADPSFAFSVETGYDTMLKQGFKASQIILGIPAYGKRLELVSPTLKPKIVNGFTTYYYQNHTKVTPPGGPLDDRPGKDVCNNTQTWTGSWLTTQIIAKGWLSRDQKKGGNGFTRYYDDCSGLPFLTNGKYFIAYEDIFSSVKKAEFAKRNRMAGVYFFDTLGPPDATVKATQKAIHG